MPTLPSSASNRLRTPFMHPIAENQPPSTPTAGSRRLRATTFALVGWFVFSGTGLAQEPSVPAPTDAATAVPVSLSDAPTRAIQALRSLRVTADNLIPKANVLAIENGLQSFSEQTRTVEIHAREVLSGTPSDDAISELEAHWKARQTTLDSWSSTLQRRSAGLESDLNELSKLKTVWTETQAQAASADAPEVVQSRIREVLDSIASVTKQVEQRRGEILTTQEEVGALGIVVDSILTDSAQARASYVGRLWVRQRQPLWDLPDEGDQQKADLWSRFTSSASSQLEGVRSYVSERPTGVLVHLLATLAVALLLRRGKRRAEMWAEEEPELESVTQTLALPYSTAALLSLIAVPWLYPLAPLPLVQLATLIALVPAIRCLRRLVPAGMLAGLYALGVFQIVDRFRALLVGAEAIQAVVFVAEMLAALLVTNWVFSGQKIEALAWERNDRRGGFLRYGRTGVLVLFATAAAAATLGYIQLGELIGDGALTSAYAALLLYAAVGAAQGVWTYLLRSKGARYLRSVASHRTKMQVRGQKVIAGLAVMAWSVVTLRSFALLVPLWQFCESVLGARLSRGNLSLSLGDVALFVGSVWAAMLLSRFVRFILNEDVFPRVKAAHGVPYAISTLVHYALVIGGFLVGIAAIGFDTSRFTIVAGALGVGIGFGLQNVVNNFVSGLILLFERPIQVGDAVELGQLSGEVRRIGIRSSTIRTWDGAEVIVPNGSLISDSVTNWTLSDRSKRIEIPVGVAYGTDPSEVVSLLTKTISQHPEIVALPPPNTLFVGFGDSSLNFLVRGWTAKYDRWVAIRSELMVAIDRALKDANMEIPFPQRDLHLRSMPPLENSNGSNPTSGQGDSEEDNPPTSTDRR